jgi:protein-tyrosine phosphatase
MVGRILVVCTANVCRSPLAAKSISTSFADATSAVAGSAVAASAVGPVGSDCQLLVESAGIAAEPGSSWCVESAEMANVDVSDNGHVSQPLDAEQLRLSDAVITLDRSQRAFAARLLPQCRTRLFTLTQADLLAAQVGEQLLAGTLPEGAATFPMQRSERIGWFVAEMDAARGSLSGLHEDALDIPDMHDGSGDHAALHQVREASSGFGTWLSRVVTYSAGNNEPAPPRHNPRGVSA